MQQANSVLLKNKRNPPSPPSPPHQHNVAVAIIQDDFWLVKMDDPRPPVAPICVVKTPPVFDEGGWCQQSPWSNGRLNKPRQVRLTKSTSTRGDLCPCCCLGLKGPDRREPRQRSEQTRRPVDLSACFVKVCPSPQSNCSNPRENVPWGSTAALLTRVGWTRRAHEATGSNGSWCRWTRVSWTGRDPACVRWVQATRRRSIRLSADHVTDGSSQSDVLQR